MPRTNYRPSKWVPVGYALPLLDVRAKDHDKTQEDKPTVLVDPFADGMERGLVEAVCMALELWEPKFDHWEDPPPLPKPKDGSEPWDTRQVPVFRGRHADRVWAFRNDIAQYTHAHRVEPSKAVIMKIAAKYVHLRVTPLKGMKDPFGHTDTTPYYRETIRPYVRRSDREWDRARALAARAAVSRNLPHRAHSIVGDMLDDYDEHHGTAVLTSYQSEAQALFDDGVHLWEHWRLIAYHVQDIVDSRTGLDDGPGYRPIPARKVPAKKVAAKKAARKVTA